MNLLRGGGKLNGKFAWGSLDFFLMKSCIISQYGFAETSSSRSDYFKVVDKDSQLYAQLTAMHSAWLFFFWFIYLFINEPISMIGSGLFFFLPFSNPDDYLPTHSLATSWKFVHWQVYWRWFWHLCCQDETAPCLGRRAWAAHVLTCPEVSCPAPTLWDIKS
jgi:hypothetical protein